MVGAAPSFSEVHLVRALLVLSQDKVGRKNLVSILGVGEGSVRTIIKKLSSEGLISSNPRGQELTKKGREVVGHYLNRFTLPEIASLDIAPGKKCSVVALHKAHHMTTTGVAEREIAVREGAEGAVILKHKGSGIVFPCGGIYLDDYPKTKKFLYDKNLGESDAFVISFSDNENKAIDGALAIVLDLISK